MSQNCPSCGHALAAEHINLSEGVALCPSCGRLSRLSEVVEQSRPLDEILARPPRGCSIIDLGNEVRLRASLRSLGGAAGALFLGLFWNSIVSIFVLVAISGLYTNLVGPLPAWYPGPTPNSDGKPIPLGIAIFLCIFLIPFVTIGAALLGAVVACVAGRVEVVLGQPASSVRTGVGPFAWTRRFQADQVKRVSNGLTSWRQNDEAKEIICIEADRTVKFGSALPDERREWLRAALHVLLVAPDSPQRQLLLTQR